jgi:ATP-dependent DNA helicase UvrD/PcrA
VSAQAPERPRALVDLLAGLDPEQAAAACAPEGPLLVLAGAGSGKTRVLTTRVAYSIATGRVPAGRVLAITFTNKAADELATRFAELVGEAAARELTMGTFHSVCARILRPHAPRVGRTGRFSIYDADASRKLIGRALQEAGARELIEPRLAASEISVAKARLWSPADYSDPAGMVRPELLQAVWERYELLLARADALDFDDLLVRCVELLRQPDLLEHFQRRFRLVVVDEYQDTNRAQYEWLRLLCHTHRNLTVCGDDDQAVYGWRGADVRNVLDFGRDWPDATMLALERNYRSSGRIVAAAARLVAHNRARAAKRIWTDADDGPELAVLGHGDELEEAGAAAAWCCQRLESGEEPGELALLYRTNELGRAVEDALLVAGVHYRVLGGRGFFDRAEVKDALAYLALVANPRDLVAFGRAAQTPRRGVGPAAIARIQAFADAQGVDLLEACARVCEVPGLRKPQREAVEAFGTALREIAAARPGPADALVRTLVASGLPDALRGSRTEQAREQLERLRDLVRSARAYEATHPQASLAEFVAQAALVGGPGEGETAAVTLGTVHAAKGLEWRRVRVLGLEEGSFPHLRALKAGDEEQERRLAYVAMTRAREELVLSYARERAGSSRAPSRFIAEATGPRSRTINHTTQGDTDV